jgi:hypothetical protein
MNSADMCITPIEIWNLGKLLIALFCMFFVCGFGYSFGKKLLDDKPGDPETTANEEKK